MNKDESVYHRLSLWVIEILQGDEEMWGCFAGKARKTPPHTPLSTQSIKEPLKLVFYFLGLNSAQKPAKVFV